MKNQQPQYRAGESDTSQSNRILVLAVAGILFLTLYPFRFSFHPNVPLHNSPFFLVSGTKTSGTFNALLNIALFVPFGFGLSQKLREKGKAAISVFGITVAAGALFSYGIELMQIYVPTRDSGWEDVLTNTTGAAVGFFAAELFGAAVLKPLSTTECWLERVLGSKRYVWIISLYFLLWISSSVPLQTKSRLNNWLPDSQLLVGNDSSGHLDRAWKGRVSQLQLWDRALPADHARRITAGEIAPEPFAPLASYKFSQSSSIRDENRVLPELKWLPGSPNAPESQTVVLTGNYWLASNAPVTSLIETIQRRKQFSIRTVLAPSEVEGSDGRIVSISGPGGTANLTLRQRDANLAFWFRTPLSVRRDQQLTWVIPDIFALGQIRDILFSYDGANLSLYIDGKKYPRTYELTPGTPLAQMVTRVKASELEGYAYIYYVLVFLPGGALLGIAARQFMSRNARMPSYLAVVIASSVCLEFVLVRVSGRAFALGNIFFSMVLMIGGIIWINADRRMTGRRS